MNKKLSIVLLSLILIFAFSSVSFAQHQYAGIKSCKMCHKGETKGMIFEKWSESKHAAATDTIIAKGEGENAKCLGCHSTGYGAGGYDPKAEDPTLFAGVQCESCHGPGSDYKNMKIMKDPDASMANGLLMPTEETCKKCHNTSNHKDLTFNFKEASKKIEHKLPE